VIWGWGVAQYPVLLPGTAVTLSNAGAPHATLVAIVVLFVVAVVIVGPSFALLFSLQGRRLLHTDDDGTVLATVPAGQSQPAGPPGGPKPPAAPPGVRAAVLALVVVDALVRALARRRRGR
jgi:cytochrome d ubiquinol oxidase subunit II